MKQLKTSVVINDDVKKKIEFLNSKGINISYEFRQLIHVLYKKINENDNL